MKTLKLYESFSQEYRLNENLLKKAWGTIVNFFRKKYNKGSWLYYALFLKKTGQLPKNQVEIIVPSNYPIENVPLTDEPELEKESFKDTKIGVSFLTEEVVSLKHPDPGIRNVDVDELVDEIIEIYEMNNDRVEQGQKRTKNDALFIWGAPGIGKTEILGQVAEKLGCIVQEWHLSQIEPTDFRGVPKIENILGSNDPKDERTVTKLPAIFPTDDGINGRGGIMFFDELNRANKMVLSAALSLCLNGRMNTYELPPRWIVIAAGNRPEDLGGGVATELEPALANRFAHVNYAPTLQAWQKWAIKQPHINPDILTFLNWNKSFFHSLDPDQENLLTFPSPRSWEQASKKDYYKRRKNWKNKLPYNVVADIYTTLVGAKAAVQFVEYLKLKDFYSEKDVKDVYDKGKLAKQPPSRLDQRRAAMASIAFFKRGEKVPLKEVQNVFDFATSLKNDQGGADIESMTSLLSYFGWVHPEVKTEEPYKKLWWDTVKKWHVEIKELS
jgi:hypothetical protein